MVAEMGSLLVRCAVGGSVEAIGDGVGTEQRERKESQLRVTGYTPRQACGTVHTFPGHHFLPSGLALPLRFLWNSFEFAHGSLWERGTEVVGAYVPVCAS